MSEWEKPLEFGSLPKKLKDKVKIDSSAEYLKKNIDSE